MPKTNEYLNNKLLYKETVYAQNKGEYTRELYRMHKMLVDRVSFKYTYKQEDDREDCKSYALERLYLGYRKFDYESYDNAFAYFTEIIKVSFARQFNLLMKNRDFNFSELFTQGEVNI